jgi:hypothetical protein
VWAEGYFMTFISNISFKIISIIVFIIVSDIETTLISSDFQECILR